MITIYKVTILFALAGAASLAARRASAATRHALWAASLISAGLLPLLTLLIPHLRPGSAIGFLFSADAAAGPASANAGSLWQALWALGAAVALVPWLRSIRAIANLRRSSRPTEHAGGVPVLETTGDMSPMVAGSLDAAILLPSSSANWSAELRSRVLQHELAHVERRDCLWFMIGRLVCAAYWYHPLAWLALREMRREAELACDDRVLASGLSAPDYAESLVSIAKTTLTAPNMAAAMTGCSPLETRVRAILDSTVSRRPARLALVAALVLAVVAPLAALQQEPYKVGDEGVSAPRLINKVDPQYTQEAKEAKIQGTVALDTVIGRSGRVEDAYVTQSVDPGLDANAITAVKQWEFEPGTKDGEAVAVRATIEVTFSLQ